MKRVFCITLLASIYISLCATNKIVLTPSVPVPYPRAGMYGGFVNGDQYYWGGASFGRRYVTAEPAYHAEPMAYGASVRVPEGTLFIGGTDFVAVSQGVELKHGRLYKDRDTKWDFDRTGRESRTPLPVPLCRLAATFAGGYIYVAGGQTINGSNQQVFRLAWPRGTKWEVLASMPGPSRIHPVVAVQTDGRDSCLYVFGGYSPADSLQVGALHQDGYALNLRTLEWRHLEWDLPFDRRPTAGACAASIGHSFIMLVGGVDAQRFEMEMNRPYFEFQVRYGENAVANELTERSWNEYLKQPAEWHHYQQNVLVYNTVTNTWASLAGNPLLARNCAVMVPYGSYFFYAGGNIRPRTGSTDVTCIEVLSDTSFGWLGWTLLVVYLCCLLAVGYLCLKRGSQPEDCFRGARNLPSWAMGLSLCVTFLPAIVVFLLPALSYRSDWSVFPLCLLALLAVLPVVSRILPRIWQKDSPCVFTFVERNGGVGLRRLTSLLFAVFALLRNVAFLVFPSIIVAAATGINSTWLMLMVAVVATVLAVSGGIRALVHSDLIQGFLLFAGLLFVVGFVLGNCGFDDFARVTAHADKWNTLGGVLPLDSIVLWVLFASCAVYALLSYTFDQSMAQRLLCASTLGEAKRSARWSLIWCVALVVLLLGAGTSLYVYFSMRPSEMDFTLQRFSAVFPYFLHSQLPLPVSYLVLLPFLTVALGAVGSGLNAIGTCFTDMSEGRKSVGKARIFMVFASILMIFVAILVKSSLKDLFI